MSSAAVSLVPSLSIEPSSPALDEARKAFRTLEGWLLSSEALLKPIHEVEREQKARGREVMRLLLQAHIDARGRGDVGPALSVGGGDDVAFLSHRRKADRDLRTVFGAVEVKRLAYSYPGEQAVHPIDESLQLGERSYSYETMRLYVQESVKGPFGEATTSVNEQTSLRASKRTVEEMVQEAAADFDQFYEQRVVPPPEETAEIVVAAVDCKGIPILRDAVPRQVAGAPIVRQEGVKQMATVATVYTVKPRPRTPEEVLESLFKDPAKPKIVGVKEKTPEARPEHKRVWASLDDGKDAVIQQAGAEVERRDPKHTKKKVALTDGERALQQRVRRYLPTLILILDLLHVLEKLWKVANIFYGKEKENAVAREAWVYKQTLRILKGQTSQVVRGIRQSITKRNLKGDNAKKVGNVANYLYRNRRYMRYDSYLAEGLPIASGAVEGACKTLIKDRMERSGMRWGVSTEAVLKMRAVYLSGDLEEYWKFHIAEDQKRLYSGRRWSPAGVEKK